MTDDSTPTTAASGHRADAGSIAPVARQSVVDAVSGPASRRDPLRAAAPRDTLALGARALAGARREPPDAPRVARPPRGAGPHHDAARRGTSGRIVARARGPGDARDAGAGLKLADPAWHELVRQRPRNAAHPRRLRRSRSRPSATRTRTCDAIAAGPGPPRARRRSRSPSRARTSRSCARSARRRATWARAPSQHVRALARRAPAPRRDALRRLRRRGAALSLGDSPDRVPRRRGRAHAGAADAGAPRRRVVATPAAAGAHRGAGPVAAEGGEARQAAQGEPPRLTQSAASRPSR